MSVDTTTTSRPYAPNRVRKLANDTMFMRTFSTTSRFAQSRVIASELMRSKIVSSTCRHQRQPRHTSWWLSAAALAAQYRGPPLNVAVAACCDGRGSCEGVARASTGVGSGGL